MSDLGTTIGPVAEAPTTSTRTTLNTQVEQLRWPITVTLSCVLAAVIATWPLATNLTSAVLLGTEHEVTTQLFSIWTLWWNADRAANLFTGYWDAPFFFPTGGVLSFSEPQTLTGVVLAPMWSLGAPPVLIYNVALLLMLTLNGIFAYRLARALKVTHLAALVGGLLAVTLPFVANMIGVLNLVPIFGMLWTLDGLVRFGESGQARHAWWAGGGFAVTYLTCQQYGLMFAPFALAAGVVALRQQGFRKKQTLRLLAAAVVTGLVVLFMAVPALIIHNQFGFNRSEFVVQKLSAGPGDFFTRPGTAWLGPQDPADTAGLFPGFLLLVMSLVGVVLATSGKDPKVRGWAIYLIASVGVAVVLAMGLNVNLFGVQPFHVLRIMLPGYAELRSPFRFAIIVQALLPVLAAITLARVEQGLVPWLRSSRVSSGRLRHASFAFRPSSFVLILGLLGAAENLSLPQPIAAIPTTPATAWTTWLRSQPDDTVVAHVPFPKGLSVAVYQVETMRMFAQMDYRKPMVNGYSGNFPPGYTSFQLDMAERFPAADLLCTLNKSLYANMLVVDQRWLKDHTRQMAPFDSFLRPSYSDSQVQIYALNPPEGSCKSP